ncbi:MAG TPA: GNAT family N-acetyltransferase [Candidatus Dojkabacteria bacterium]|nr:GNAT family N-acetyltransferase [Candidatus Dojkabacteria bacterium]
MNYKQNKSTSHPLDFEFKETLSSEEVQSLKKMQQEVFGDTVSETEASEDFINEPYAHILIKKGEKIVGCLDLHRSVGQYDGKKVFIGGLSIGILEEYRNLGLGGKLIANAMSHLKENQYDFGFLAAAPGTIPLYEKYGWSVLAVPYTWENSKGAIKSDKDGMIIPFKDSALVDRIQNGKLPVHIGRGYW